MKLKSPILLCLGLAAGVLPAQTDRPVDDLTDLPPVSKPLGVLEFPNLDPQLHPDVRIDPESGLIVRVRGPVDHALENFFSSASEPRWQIGVMLDPVSGGGMKVLHLVPDSPAAKAGLREGDVITKLNQLIIRDFAMITGLIQIVQDQEVVLTVKREGSEIEVRVTPQKIDQTPRGRAPDLLESEDVPIEPVPGPDFFPGAPPRKAEGGPPRDLLHQDNQEMKRLLRELINEVKKLQKD